MSPCGDPGTRDALKDVMPGLKQEEYFASPPPFKYDPHWTETQVRDVEDVRPDDIVILVFGPSGSGKTTFISRLVEDYDIEIGHRARPCTVDIGVYSFKHVTGRRVVLVDTPAFDDVLLHENIQVLIKIARFLARIYAKGIRLSNTLFLVKSRRPRINAKLLKNILMFREMCGEGACMNVVSLPNTRKLSREREVNVTFDAINLQSGSWQRESFWEKLASKQRSPMEIIDRFVMLNRTVTLLLQQELIVDKSALNCTRAGRKVTMSLPEAMVEEERYGVKGIVNGYTYYEGSGEDLFRRRETELLDSPDKLLAMAKAQEDLKITLTQLLGQTENTDRKGTGDGDAHKQEDQHELKDAEGSQVTEPTMPNFDTDFTVFDGLDFGDWFIHKWTDFRSGFAPETDMFSSTGHLTGRLPQPSAVPKDGGIGGSEEMTSKLRTVEIAEDHKEDVSYDGDEVSGVDTPITSPSPTQSEVSSSSEDTEETRDEPTTLTPKQILVQCLTRTLQSSLNKYLEKLNVVQPSQATFQAAHQGNGEGASASTINSFSASNRSASKGKRAASCSREGDGNSGDNGDDDDDGDNERHTKKPRNRSREELCPELLFACPFYKRRPFLYQGIKWRTCIQPCPSWTQVHRVKQHLLEHHMLKPRCDRCGDEFSDDTQRIDHQRQTTPCGVKPLTQAEGIDLTMRSKLMGRKGTRNMSEHDKWCYWYQMLFPSDDAKDMPSPYHEAWARVPGPVEDFMRHDFVPAVQRELERLLPAQLSTIMPQLLETLRNATRNVHTQYTESQAALTTSGLVAANTGVQTAVGFSFPNLTTQPLSVNDDVMFDHFVEGLEQNSLDVSVEEILRLIACDQDANHIFGIAERDAGA